ncbi:MAG: dTMP kinase [Candidatus Cloacimonetes bacterium]|nr:dTMP kinase [Candidatus Cloacimonadota bacterium]
MMKGKFITFEGVEGSGKSTQIKLLSAELSRCGIPFLCTREPGGPAISEEIRRILLNPVFSAMLPRTELLLYMASRCQHTGEWIIPALVDGKTVLCDRYYDSTFAYQGAARNLNHDSIEFLTNLATFGTVPDLTILLDLPVDKGRERIKDRYLDRLEQENPDFHEKVRQQYLVLAAQNGTRYLVVDAGRDILSLHLDICTAVLKLIGVTDV